MEQEFIYIRRRSFRESAPISFLFFIAFIAFSTFNTFNTFNTTPCRRRKASRVSQPLSSALLRRPPPPLLPVECPPPPWCIILRDEGLVGKLPVKWFDRPGWKCTEKMKTCDFLPKDNIVSSLYLGNVDIRAASVFCNYVKPQPITNDEGGGDRVFKPSVKETFPWPPSNIKLDIDTMSQVLRIAHKFQMRDLEDKAWDWIAKKNSRASLPVASDTSSQKSAPGGKPEQSGNVEQPDGDEQPDDDEQSDDDERSDDDEQIIEVSLERLKALEMADRREMFELTDREIA